MEIVTGKWRWSLSLEDGESKVVSSLSQQHWSTEKSDQRETQKLADELTTNSLIHRSDT